ncbi:MAG: TonB-dependent receptor plug domain-containing protein [Cyclobacteriaceae bacterium]|nr:TonB-dependent receptor plug domain-containing protein [Cyclobacteriaceae bacterium HetDA_MAG_MS6]
MKNLILEMRYIWLVGLCLSAANLVAQEDTVFLQALIIPGESVQNYLPGESTTIVDIQPKDVSSELSSLLQNNTGLYLRKYGGEGQLSSISFRGTTPNHTILTWHGVDINSQTLGQTDFSSLNTFLFSGVNIYHGASSSVFGSGSMGGTIELINENQKDNGIAIEAQVERGSFGKQFHGLKLNFKKGRWLTGINGFSNQVDNNFRVNFRGEEYNQNNASSHLLGVLAFVGYQLSDRSRLEMDVWFNRHDREIQPIMGDRINEDEILDRNVRVNVKYQTATKVGFLESNISYIDDRQTYNHSSHTNLKRYVLALDYDLSLVEKLTLKLGGGASLLRPDVDSYDDDVRQERADLYVLSAFQLLENMKLIANLRQAFMTGFNAPVSPAFGVEWVSNNINWGSSLHLTRNYRLPTLNDLFWRPGGNPNLKAEDGWMTELGAFIAPGNDRNQLKLKGNIYRNLVNNLIQWIPGGQGIDEEGNPVSFWFPQNVRKVHITGLEVDLEYKYQLSPSVRAKVSGTYAFVKSINKTKGGASDRSLNKQLAYIPRHKATQNLTLWLGSSSFSVDHVFTGLRYTEANNENSLPAFGIWQTSVGHQFKWKQSLIELGFQVRNVLNKAYQNYELRATPGRNYLINLNYKFSKLSS